MDSLRKAAIWRLRNGCSSGSVASETGAGPALTGCDSGSRTCGGAAGAGCHRDPTLTQGQTRMLVQGPHPSLWLAGSVPQGGRPQQGGVVVRSRWGWSGGSRGLVCQRIGEWDETKGPRKTDQQVLRGGQASSQEGQVDEVKMRNQHPVHTAYWWQTRNLKNPEAPGPGSRPAARGTPSRRADGALVEWPEARKLRLGCSLVGNRIGRGISRVLTQES